MSAADYAADVDRIAARLPFVGAPSLLTAGERAFWHPLRMAVGNQYAIFCKVRLADLAVTRDGRADAARRFRDIQGFHVDLCFAGRPPRHRCW